MSDARDLSLTVLPAGDPGIEALRIFETSTASLRDSRHGFVAQALIFHPDSSEEDRLKGFQNTAQEAPAGTVAQIWYEMPIASRKDPRIAKVFSDRLRAEGRADDAALVLLGVP